jgi:type VI secretion system protein ImpC
MSFDFQFSSPKTGSPRPPREDTPFRILLLGDYSARGAGAVGDLASRKPVQVDVDNVEQVMASLRPKLSAGAGDGELRLEFSRLEDFHPDSLFARLPLFKGLRDTRQRLQNPATFAEAAASFRCTGAALPAGAAPAATAAPGAAAGAATGGEADADTLARLLGSAPPRAAAAPPQAAGGIDALIRRVVAPHIVADAAPHQAQYLAAVDAAVGEQMRQLLHSSEFRAIESRWRAVHWLVSNLETDEALQIHLLDASRAELLADARRAASDGQTSALVRRLVEQGVPGGEPWSLIAGDFSFGPAADDIALLGFLGFVARAAGGPFVAAAKPGLIGCSSPAAMPEPRDWAPPQGDAAAAWTALRASAMAPSIGLVFPRLLLRAPYGSGGEATETFAFEELVAEHEDFVWGNGAIAGALHIGRAFAADGWEMNPDQAADIEDLPAYLRDAAGGHKELLPCAEAHLGDRAAQALLDAGVMPLLSHKQRNAVRLPRLASIARPASALQGAWVR